MKTMKPSTIAIHTAQDPHNDEYGSVITPIYMTSTYAQKVPGETKQGTQGAYEYARSGNPTRTVLENVLAAMDEGQHGFVFASGMAALSTMVMALLSSGDHVILGDDVYGGTFRLVDKVFNRFDITTTQVDMTDSNAIENAIQSNTKMVVIETPTNPLLKLADIEAISKITKKHDIISVVDNTFTTSVIQKPLKHNADIVLYSTTKYINGHSDVVGGALVLNNQDYADKIALNRKTIGGTADTFASWLVLRGLKTLPLRMERQSQSALALAQFLESHKNVENVIYPGLPSHPQHDLAKNQMKDYGGMITMRIKGNKDTVQTFLNKIKYFILAESLGSVESLIEIPAVMTHASLTPEAREDLGITDTLIRMSVGIEDIDDLKDDLTNALNY